MAGEKPKLKRKILTEGPEMQISKDRSITTHVGSLPRPRDLFDMLIAEDQAKEHDASALEVRVARAVKEVVSKQLETGIDVVSDGEMSKIGYTFYVKHRLSGIRPAQPPGANPPPENTNLDMTEHPDFAQRVVRARGGWGLEFGRPWVVGPVEYTNDEPLKNDIAHLNEALAKNPDTDAFMNAASPGVLSKFVPNDYYPDEDTYIDAMAAAMKTEYEAIHAAGFILQIDCPD